MPYVDKDEAGNVVARYANKQRDGQEWLEENDPALIVKWSPDPILNQVRSAIEIVLNRLTGIRQDAQEDGDIATVSACRTAKGSLINITTAPTVAAAIDDASFRAALMTIYAEIIMDAGPNLAKAFAEFNL